MHWYEQAEDDLGKQYQDGEITCRQFQAATRKLRCEMRDVADQTEANIRLGVIEGMVSAGYLIRTEK